jgi:predicted transcriptional regulator
MEIKKVADLLKATIVCGENHLHGSIKHAFASDLMSDVLTLEVDQLLLVTGLCNLQTIRTAEMADISYILFVRGKKVTDEMKNIASENHMVLLECPYSMFRAVGMLYSEGLKPVY